MSRRTTKKANAASNKAEGRTKPRGGRNPAKGRPFDKARRERFLLLVSEGAAVASAAKMVRIATATVYEWLRKGRLDGARVDHRDFAKRFDEVEASCTHEAVKLLNVHARSESPMAVKATLALLQARDARFGDRRLKHLQARTELEKSKAELELTKLKVKAAEKALEGEGVGAIILGVEALLEAPMPADWKDQLRAAIASGKVRTLGRWGLGDEPAP